MGGPDGAGQLRLHVLAAQAGIAAGIELHGIGEQHSALPVDLDAAALVDKVGTDDRNARGIGDDAADAGIEIPLRPILGTPAVEHPVHRCDGAVGGVHERRPDIAHPGVIDRGLDDLDARREVPVGDGAFPRMHDDGDGFELGDGVGDGGPGGSRLVPSRVDVAQRIAFAGKRHPDPFLRCGFGRHPVARIRNTAHR